MAISARKITSGEDLIDLYQQAIQLSSAEQADEIELEELIELGKTALNKAVRVVSLEGKGPIVRYNRLTRAGTLDAAASHPSASLVSDGRWYGRANFDILPPWHLVFPTEAHGRITEVDPEKPYMVLRPRRTLTDEFSDRFKVNMLDEEGLPLVYVELLPEK